MLATDWSFSANRSIQGLFGLKPLLSFFEHFQR